MDFLKLLLILCILSIIPGQLVRIPIYQTATLTVSDIIVLAIFIFSIPYLFFKKRSLKIRPQIAIPVAIFTTIAAGSTVLALNTFTQKEIAVSALFLIRFLLYFSISIIASNIISKKDASRWVGVFLTAAFIFALVGFAQLLLFPDLTFLTQYGWDPHQKRIVSTFLDPNFSGGLLVGAFSFASAFFLKDKKPIYLLLSLVFFTSLIFTFSRSTYLAFFTALLILGFLKSPRLLISFLAVFILSFLTIGQVRTRIEGAFTLDETSQARIESWQRAITIFSKNPLLGVGFNTYRYAQQNEGFFTTDDPLGGHSGAGSDSSILLVAATTGIIGAAAYLALLFAMLKTFLKNAVTDPLKLGALSTFLALLVHSQFVNSLFFPQIMIVLWISLALSTTYDSKD